MTAKYIYEDGTVELTSDNPNYQNINNWTNVVQLVTYNRRLRGLCEDGTILNEYSDTLNQENPDRQVKIMRGIVTLSEELDAQIVCEGVETQKDVNLMKEIGAFVAQGFFYSRPIPEEEFEALLNVGNV